MQKITHILYLNPAKGSADLSTALKMEKGDSNSLSEMLRLGKMEKRLYSFSLPKGFPFQLH